MNRLRRTSKPFAAQRNPRRRLLVEQLEDRKLLAVIAHDGFESGNFNGGSGWVGASWYVVGNPAVLSSEGPHADQYHARMQGSLSYITRVIDVKGYNDVHLQFSSKVNSFEGADKASVLVSFNGIGPWSTVQKFSKAHSDNQYHDYDIAIADPGDTLYVRFEAGMSDTSDQWYLDDIAVTGTPSTPQISISDAVVTEGEARYRYTDDFVPPDGSGLAAGRMLVVGSDERVYVVSRDTNSVKVFEGGTGEFLGELEAAPGVLDAPSRAMAFGPDGRLYVGGVNSDNILAFDVSDLTAPSTYDVYVPAGSGGLNGPGGLTFGPDGHLYVSSTTGGGGAVGPHEVLRFEGPGGATPGAPLPAPGKSGAVFVTDGDGNLSNPNQLVFGPDGALYVASTWRDEIVRYNSTDGAYISTFVAAGSGGLDTPNFIMFRDDGLLYVGSQSTNQVLRYNASNGSFQDVFVTTPNGPSGFAFAASGDFYLSAGTGLGVLGSSVRRYKLMEGAEFSVSFDAPFTTAVSVNYASANGTALADSDFTAVSGTLTFAPGETSKTIFIPTLDDLDLEGDETFFINLTNPIGAGISDAQGVGTIVDDEFPPHNDFPAASENSVYGSVTGSYLATQVDDGWGETLTEERYSVGRRTRFEHRWQFDGVTVPNGDSLELLVVAAQTNINPVETFSFSYSTDNANWTTLGNLGPSSFPLPSSLSGTVYVRVVDTDRSNGETTLDVLVVDQLLIRATANAPANLSSPLAPPLSSFANTASLDQSSTEAEQLRNQSLISDPVLVAQRDKPRLAQSTAVSHPTTDSPPASIASSDSDADSADEVFGEWGFDSSPLRTLLEFDL